MNYVMFTRSNKSILTIVYNLGMFEKGKVKKYQQLHFFNWVTRKKSRHFNGVKVILKSHWNSFKHHDFDFNFIKFGLFEKGTNLKKNFHLKLLSNVKYKVEDFSNLLPKCDCIYFSFIYLLSITSLLKLSIPEIELA
jgi:hypothetical protein